MQTANDRLQALAQAHALIASLGVQKPVQGDAATEVERNLKRNILNEMEEMFPIFREAAESEGNSIFRSES